MKTCGTDTVLCKLRVSSFSPSPDASTSPTLSRKFQNKTTTVYNGVSANSWLLPIGICEREATAENQPETVKTRSHVKTNQAKPTEKVKDSSEVCSESVGEDVDNEAVDKEVRDKEETDCKDEDKSGEDAVQTTKSSRPLTSEEFDSIWERVSQRPQHTGKIFIVRRRNVPEGIHKNEYLQGKHLRSKFEADAHADEDTDIRLQPRPFTAPGKRKRSSRYPPPPRPFSHTGIRRVKDSYEKSPPQTESINLSLDLVITSLSFSAHDPSKTPVQDGAFTNPGQPKTSREGYYSSRPKTASALSSKSQNHGQPLNTIDGIKRDYLRRAKSAPPNGRSKDIPPSPYEASTTSSRAPSLYWRARSSYHKKLMTYGHDEIPDPNEQTQSIRGSLWRPLIVGEEGSVMQHSAGCPYKCKGCFKACLVSEDYLEKARAQKALKEREQARQVGIPAAPHGRPGHVPHKYKVKLNNPKNLISIALAKSQPLYQVVHGAKSSSPTTTTTTHEDGALLPSTEDNEDGSKHHQGAPEDVKHSDTSPHNLQKGDTGLTEGRDLGGDGETK